MHTLSILFSRIRTYALAHKGLSAVVAVVLLGGGWFVWGHLTAPSAAPRYILGTVARGTMVSTVSGSGQVEANQQLTVTPQVSGQIIYIGVTPGQHVGAGQLIAEIDPTDAQKAVRDAQASLQSAQLSLAKVQEPATQLTLTQQQDAIVQGQTALTTDYQTAQTDIANTFLDLPSIMTGIQNVDFGTDAAGNNSQWNIDYYGTISSIYDSRGNQYRNDAYNAYQAARTSYDKTLADYKALPASPDTATVEQLLKETYDTSVLVQAALKSTYTLIQFYNDQLTQASKTPTAAAATDITNLNSYISKVNPHVTSLLNDTNSIANDKAGLTEKQQTLAQTQAGADPLTVQSSQLSVTQAQNALTDAQNTLAKYYIRAPFSGTIASVPANKYDQAGSGTTIATLITPQQMADLSLNEVDAAKVQLGDKATLTFDAIPDLTLTGTVAQLDPVGTVSQGVVSYDVKIRFDTQDARVKTGMTVNAEIQTAVHQDVLFVPQSAVKTQSGQSYVLVFTPPIASSTIAAAGTQGVSSSVAPEQVLVTTGIADDTSIEITSGLSEGQQIVTRTTSGTTAQTTSTTGGQRGFGGGGGALRIGG